MRVLPSDRIDYERRNQLLRDALDEETFAQEWEAGLVLTTEEALSVANETL